jgi:hypothetical protein
MLLAGESATLHDRLDDVAVLAARTNKATVLVVQQFPVVEDRGLRFPPVRESIANVMAFVELGAACDLAPVLDCAGAFDWIAVDCDDKLPASASIVETARSQVAPERLLFYSDNQVWFDSALDMVQRIERGLSGKVVVLCGAGALADSIAFALPRLGVSVLRPSQGGSRLDSTIVLGASQKRESIGVELVERLPAGASIYDLGIGNLSAAAAELARSRGFALYRLDNRAGISSAIVRLLETDNMVSTLMGRARLRNVDLVAGGLLAPAGAVIVDDIRRPTMIFGIADGTGRFKRELDAADHERLQYVRSIIAHALAASPAGSGSRPAPSC